MHYTRNFYFLFCFCTVKYMAYGEGSFLLLVLHLPNFSLRFNEVLILHLFLG